MCGCYLTFYQNRFKTIYLENEKITFITFIVLTSCKTDVKKEKSYQLIWSDEFNQEKKRLDSTKWFLETIAPNNGSWYNNELQHYTDRIDNAYVSNGTLKIVAKKEEFQSSGTTKLYTSARLNSKLSFTYGKVEVSAKLPRAKGTWPAIWTLGSNFETVIWPACGEIDIMEQLFEDFEMVQCAVHTPDTYGDNTIVKQINVTDVTENFHTYGLEWTKENLKFFVDGNHYFTYEPKNKTPKNWPYVNDQFIILNIAMGGNLGGSIDPNFSEDQMEVDFVRVYQQK